MNAEAMTIETISGIDIEKVQAQASGGAQENNKMGRRFVLAYVGAWAFVYDRVIGLYHGTCKVINTAEKRGEAMEAAVSKRIDRFERRADHQMKTIQEQFSGSTQRITHKLSGASETMEGRLEEQIERVLINLGIPTRERLERLNQEIDRLNTKLDEELARQHSAGA